MKKLMEVYRENTGWMMAVKINNPLSSYNDDDILTSIFSNNTNMTYAQAKKMASEIIED